MGFAKTLRRFRKARHIQQNEMASWLNVSPKIISSWESGRTEPDIETIRKLCRIFNCTSDELLEIGGEKVDEDKHLILNLLLHAIQQTRAGDDVTALRYDPLREEVHVDFISGTDGRIINVAMDSGWAMIKDVVNNIDIG